MAAVNRIKNSFCGGRIHDVEISIRQKILCVRYGEFFAGPKRNGARSEAPFPFAPKVGQLRNELQVVPRPRSSDKLEP
jgi:hypothetical protein